MRIFIGFLMIAIILFTSCGDDEFTGTLESGNISNYFQELKVPVQSFTINADTGGRLVTSRNSVLRFEPSAFVDEEGEIVRGNVTIEFLELLTKNEILLYGIHTVSDRRLLESAGEFNIQAYRETSPTSTRSRLRLRDEGVFNLFIALEDIGNREMELFYGFEGNNWIEADQDSTSQESVRITEIEIDSTQQNGSNIWTVGYEMIPDQLDWINCDDFYNYPNGSTNLEIDFGSEEYDNINTIVYVIFKNLNSVMQANFDRSSRTYKTYNVPVGEEVEVISITNVEKDEYLYDSKDLKIKEGKKVELDPKKKSLDDIKKDIENLTQ